MFTVSTCHLVLQWVGNMDLILDELWHLAGNQSTGSNEPAAPDDYLAEFVAKIGSFYLPMINCSMSDGIALWRVWIMWGRSVKSLIFPVLVAVGSIGAGVFLPVDRGLLPFIAVYASTLATNIIATTLIAVKAWQHRRLLRSHLNNEEYRSPALSILALLVESGTLYCVIWIIFLACSVYSNFNVFIDNAIIAMGRILPAITVQVSGIYPTAVIALAALRETTWDMSIGNAMSQNASHTEMRFVTRTVRSGTVITQTGHHHPTPTINEGPHLHASEIEARDGEL